MPTISELTIYWNGFLLLFAAATSVTFVFQDMRLTKAHHQIEDLEDTVSQLRTSQEVARDRVSYLYDQLSRVETKVDVKEQIAEAVQEATSKAD